jgi:hypothetical protein
MNLWLLRFRRRVCQLSLLHRDCNGRLFTSYLVPLRMIWVAQRMSFPAISTGTRFTQVHYRDRAPRGVKLIRISLTVIILYSTVQIYAVPVHWDRRFQSAPQRPHIVVTQLYLRSSIGSKNRLPGFAVAVSPYSMSLSLLIRQTRTPVFRGGNNCGP